MQRRVAVTFILGLDCLYDTATEPVPLPILDLPAPIFAIELPAFARADQTFSLNAWVALEGPAHADDEIVPETFVAEVDVRARTITVSGRARRVPGGPAPRPRVGRALIVGIPASAPAGTYTVRIPSGHYTAGDGRAFAEEGECPTPSQTQTLVVHPGPHCFDRDARWPAS